MSPELQSKIISFCFVYIVLYVIVLSKCESSITSDLKIRYTDGWICLVEEERERMKEEREVVRMYSTYSPKRSKTQSRGSHA